METASKNNNGENKAENGRFGTFFAKIFGGEVLLNKQMRPWYLYFLFVFLLFMALVISEQQISSKEKRITTLENDYKMEISRLKANNQFIPYEKSNILIERIKMMGYDKDKTHIFTVKETPKPVEERGWFGRKEKSDEN